MPLSLHLVRQEAVLLQQRKFGMAGKEVFHLLLVLPARKGAGRVHEPPTRTHKPRRILQNIVLAGNAAGDVLLAPFGDGAGILSEHPLARAGRIDENLVKIPAKRFGKLFRGGADNGAVCDAHALDVLRQDLRAVKDIFVSDEDALPPHPRGELRRLAPRRSAQVEDALPGLHLKEGRGAHRRGLLAVVEPRKVFGVCPGALLRAVEAALRPRHPFAEREGRKAGKFFLRALQKIGAHALHGRLFQAAQKGGELLFQIPIHAL